MRTLVIGDIHGAYYPLLQVMERAKVTPDDQLIFLGDYSDRGIHTPKVLDYLIALQDTHRVIYLRGNHDTLCCDFLLGKLMSPLWRSHGGKATEEAYKDYTKDDKQPHIDFLQSLRNYLLDGQNRLFLHAGFTDRGGVVHEFFQENFYWDRTLWELALATPEDMSLSDPYYPKRLTLYKEIYIGHTPTLNYGSVQPMCRHHIWNLDTGAGFIGRVTLMDIETKEYWQSDPVVEMQ